MLWSVIGDLDYFVAILKLPNFNSQRPCSLCRCSLSGTNSWSDFTPEANWRNQVWTLTSWKGWPQRSRCPLFRLSYCSALAVHLDLMHSKYLGTDQYVYGSCLALLVCEILHGTPEENVQTIWMDIKQYYRDHNVKIRYRYLNKLTMFLRKSGAPKLRGKACEIRHVAGAILHVWTKYMSGDLQIHKEIKILLKCSVRMEDLITDNRHEIAFAPEEASKYARTCQHMLTLHASLANHFAEEQTALFSLTSKAHMLQHISLLSHCINPRLVPRQEIAIFLLVPKTLKIPGGVPFWHCSFIEAFCGNPKPTGKLLAGEEFVLAFFDSSSPPK